MPAVYASQFVGGQAAFDTMYYDAPVVVSPSDMVATYGEPIEIRAGDSIDWLRVVEQCLPSDGWTLTYRLVPAGAGSPVTIATAAVDDEYRAAVAAATSATWAAGLYTLIGACIRGSSRITVYNRACAVLPDLFSATVYDGRSTARQIVAAIDEYFRTRDRAVIEKQLGDRRLRFQTDAELIATRNFYATQLITEDAAAGLAAGIGMSPSRVQVRM